MDTPVLIDYDAVAKQLLKISDIRKTEPLTRRSPAQVSNFSREDYRYYTVTALIATAIEPQKAGAVTKKLLVALDKFEADVSTGLPPSIAERRREVFVADFLREEYD